MGMATAIFCLARMQEEAPKERERSKQCMATRTKRLASPSPYAGPTVSRSLYYIGPTDQLE
jgi:hypothetical protein